MRTSSKQLRFPFAGLAKNLSYRDSTYPSDDAYATPMALNVIGTCAFSGRRRGGSRPGLSPVDGVTSRGSAKWIWPNGEPILWPDGKFMTFGTLESVEMPTGGRIVMEHPPMAVYRDRIVKAEGSVWMASRTGEHGDFDFGGESEDPTRACAGNLAKAGRKGENVTAICPIGDQRLFLATARSLYLVTGEPTGGMTCLSEFTGIVSADAWCNAAGAFYFVGDGGLYAVGEGGPILVSGRIPEDMKGLTFATLVYDPENEGIHVMTSRGDYFYDIEARAFWPVEYPPAMMPDAGGLAMIGGVNRVIFHCVDGEWRYWDENSGTDDGEAIASRVAIGPFKCGMNDDIDGMLDSLNVTLAEGSGAAKVSVFTSRTAEGAVRELENGTPRCSFEIADGWNDVVRPRARGAWCVIAIESENKWAYESVQANSKTLGRLR